MENEKQSLWKRFKNFIKKVIPGKKTIAIGAAAASMMGATMDKADAATIQSDAPNKSAITDAVKNVKTNPIDLNNLRVNASDLQPNTTTVKTEKNDLEKFMDSAKAVSQGLHNVKDTATSIENLGNSSSINSTINNAEKVVNNVNKSEETLSQVLSKPSVKKEIKTEQADASVITEKVKNVKETKIEKNNDTTERANEIINKSHFDSITYNPYDLEDALSNEIVDLQVKASSARYDGDFELAKQLENKINSLKAQRIELTNLRINKGENSEILDKDPNYQAREYTPEKIKQVTAFTNLSPEWTSGEKLAVLSNGLLDLHMAIEDCIKNGDTETANSLKKTYSSALEQRMALAKEAIQHPDDPEFNLQMPKTSYPKYPKKEVKSDVKTKKVEKTSPYLVNDPDINVDEIVGEILGTDAISNSTEKAKVTETKIDESKLADVSVGQMGVFDDLDEIIDEAIKQENQASTFKAENQVNVKTAKTVDNVKTNSNKEENKSTVNNTKVDNYKANGEKIDIDEIFKDWGILDKVQPIKNDKEKSKDDDMER